MRAGILRDRCRIEQFTADKDAAGGARKSWQLVTEVNCQIMEATGGMREYFAAGSEVAEGSTQIRMRELPDFKIDPAWRLVDVDRGDVYDIVAVRPSRLRNDLYLLCKHGGAKRP